MYYLTTHSGFKINSAPSNNKEWGFSIRWTLRTIDNTSPLLYVGETTDVDQLRGILSSSRAIKEMIEEWLVEAELSPAIGGMAIHI
ncbi:hypothetical protein C4D60_Mb03t13080 [Musa balbisiana]|uniref:Uncharacterized protein n=1 Tax=Musa balbisiana TaxID=52838 RepID=A0A4S8J9N2_MUSBA|nr:hypothetical protein C4D60_Mb03t13080 [Musa balbisiana]